MEVMVDLELAMQLMEEQEITVSWEQHMDPYMNLFLLEVAEE
jgi:hypothetical protein